MSLSIPWYPYDVVDDILNHPDSNRNEYTENKWEVYGVYEEVAESLQRLEQIANALPYIARAVRRAAPDKHTRGEWVRRAEELAAKVHHPQGSYVKLVHKRSFEEAFS